MRLLQQKILRGLMFFVVFFGCMRLYAYVDLNKMTDHAHKIRQHYIHSRDLFGKAKYEVRQWWHGLERNSIYALLLLIIIYLFASNLEYKEIAAREGERAEQATQKLAIAEQYKRSEPVLFVLPANDLGQYRQRLRDVRNVANDQIEHSKAAK